MLIAGGDLGEVETDELDDKGNPKRETYRVSLVPGENEGLMNDLFNAQIKVVVKEKKSLMSPFMSQLVFFLGFMALFYFLFYRKMGAGGGGIFSFGKSRAKVLDGKEEKRNKISFASVAGIDEAKEEVEEIVEFLCEFFVESVGSTRAHFSRTDIITHRKQNIGRYETDIGESHGSAVNTFKIVVV